LIYIYIYYVPVADTVNNPSATMICRFPMEILILALTFVQYVYICIYATGENRPR